MPAPVRAPRRLHSYSVIIGTVTGLLMAGLAVPFAFGHRISAGDSSSATTDSAAVLGSETDPGGTGGAAPTGPAGAGGATGSTGETPGQVGPSVPTGTGTSGGYVGGTTAAGTPGQVSRGLRATDTGVTATTIKIGIGLGDAGGLSKFGYADQEKDIKPEDVINTVFDYYNARGGIHGRKLIPAYVKYDALSSDDMMAACLKWTEELKVFAVLNGGGLYGPPVLCVSRDHHTPFITGDQNNASYFKASNGMLVTTQPSAQRMLANLATFAHRIGALKGEKIGIFDADGDFREPVPTALIPTLKKLGYTITTEETITAYNPELYAQQAQIAVQNMRNKGVTAVILVHNFLADALFTQAADKQLYYPKYLVSDWGSLMGNTAQFPQSFEGAIGFTGGRTGENTAGLPEQAEDKECVDIWNKSPKGKSQPFPRGDPYYGAMLSLCNMFRAFATGATLAGPDLTRTGWAAALQRSGTFPLNGAIDGSFRPGKTDANDYARQVTWRYDCTCFIPVRGSRFVKTPY